MPKTLIIYYSWSGHTATMAQQLQQLTKADCFALEVPAGTFSQDMYETSEIAKTQIQTGRLPPLIPPLPDLTAYDLILLGGPVWSGAPATPVLSLLATTATGSAVLAPFYTHAGTAAGYEAAFKQAATNRPTARGLGIPGHGVTTATAQLQHWLDQLKRRII